ARDRHGMAFDSKRARTVLFGGEAQGGQQFGDTWEWDGTRLWLVATAGPAARVEPAMAFDDKRGHTVLFGGYTTSGSTTTYLNDLWEWDSTNWMQPSAA